MITARRGNENVVVVDRSRISPLPDAMQAKTVMGRHLQEDLKVIGEVQLPDRGVLKRIRKDDYQPAHSVGSD